MKKIAICILSLISFNLFAGTCSVNVDREIPLYNYSVLSEVIDLDDRDFRTLRENIASALVERNFIPSYGNADYDVQFKLNCFQVPFTLLTNCESTVSVYYLGQPFEQKTVYAVDFANRYVAFNKAIQKLSYCK